MSKDFQIIPADMHENFQIILRFSPIFSDFLRYSLHIPFFLRIFAPENPLPVKKAAVL